MIFQLDPPVMLDFPMKNHDYSQSLPGHWVVPNNHLGIRWRQHFSTAGVSYGAPPIPRCFRRWKIGGLATLSKNSDICLSKKKKTFKKTSWSVIPLEMRKKLHRLWPSQTWGIRIKWPSHHTSLHHHFNRGDCETIIQVNPTGYLMVI